MNSLTRESDINKNIQYCKSADHFYQEIIQEKEFFENLAIQAWQRKQIYEENGAFAQALRAETQAAIFSMSARTLATFIEEHFAICRHGLRVEL